MFAKSRTIWDVRWVFGAVLLNAVFAPASSSALGPPTPVGPARVDPQVPCALSLIRSQLADCTHITVIGGAAWLGNFLRVNDVPVSLFQEGDERAPVHNQISDAVFLVTDGAGNRSFVEDALIELRKGLWLNVRVVVWWRTGDAQAAVDAVWDLEMVRLVVVSGTFGVQRVFGYREDCTGGVDQARAALLGECGEEGLEPPDVQLFQDLLYWNIHGCTVPLYVTHVPPFRVVQGLPDGGYTLRGIWAPLAYSLGQKTNATLEVRNLSLVEQFGGFWRAQSKQAYDQREVTYAFVVRTPALDRLADLNPSYFMSFQGIFVPSGLGPGTGPFDLVYREFSPAVWLMTGVACVVTLFALSWGGDHRVQDTAFFLIAGLMGNSFSFPMTSTRVRMLTVFWLMFCIVMSTAYQAVRHSLVAAPPSPPEIDSLPQLAESRLTIFGSKGTVRDIKAWSDENPDDPVLRAISARSRDMANLKDAVHRMATQRDVAVVFEPFVVKYHVARLEKESGRKLVHELPGYTASAKLVSYFVVRRGSRLTPALLDVGTRALDSGLIMNFRYLATYPRPEARQEWSPLDMDKLGAAFMLLLIGQAVGALVFIAENIVPHAKKQPRLKQN